MTLSIRLDASPTSVVAVCSLCPWRVIRGDRLAALTASAAHDRQHDSKTAANALAQARKRAGLTGG